MCGGCHRAHHDQFSVQNQMEAAQEHHVQHLIQRHHVYHGHVKLHDLCNGDPMTIEIMHIHIQIPYTKNIGISLEFLMQEMSD